MPVAHIPYRVADAVLGVDGEILERVAQRCLQDHQHDIHRDDSPQARSGAGRDMLVDHVAGDQGPDDVDGGYQGHGEEEQGQVLPVGP